MDEVLKLLLTDLEIAVGKLMEIAPEVWAVYIKQQYVYGIRSLLWAIFLLICQIPSAKLLRYSSNGLRREQRDRSTSTSIEDWTMAVVMEWCLIILLAIITVVLISGAMGRMINPNYYAIRDIFQLVKGQ